jgi:hypothetical protein
VDETYFDGQTGLIQTAFPIVSDHYEAEVVAAIKKLIEDSKPGITVNEFKASQLSAGNEPAYRGFLQHCVNAAVIQGDQSPLRPVVTFEAAQRYQGPEFNWVRDQVTGALKNIGVTGEDFLAAEFSRQVLWIWRHFGQVLDKPVGNPFAFVFDNKYSYAQKCRSLKPVKLSSSIFLFHEFGKVLTTFANTMLPRMEPKRLFPRIERFGYGFSQDNFLIQGCDLVSNLFYNSLRYAKGLVNGTTTLKDTLLRSMMPELAYPAELLDAFALSGEQLLCRSSELRWRVQLTP